jgi:hypothetical protein
MEHDEENLKDKDDLTRFRLQDFFDLRYASKEEVRIIRSLVFGAVGLILTGVALNFVSTVTHLHS